VNRFGIRLLTALTCAVAGLAWIVNSNPLSGPVVWRLSETHGVHTNDWFTFALWGAGLLVAAPEWTVASLRRLRRTA
jgi:hypothetical protein